LAEESKRRTSLISWIAFIVAAIMILIMASSTISYSPDNYAVSSINEIGAVLPYALFAATISYYILRYVTSKGTLARQLVGHTLRIYAVALLTISGWLLGLALFILLFVPFPLGTIIPPPIATVITGSGQNTFNLPTFDLLSLLAISMIVFPILVIILATYVRKKAEAFEDSLQEAAASEETWTEGGEAVYDEYRRAIIANYVQGRELMVNQGVPSNQVTTSREFEAGVLESVDEAGKDFVPLTRLFEEARFSVHQMGEPEKKKAERHHKKLEEVSKGER
jgi:hypothetical protein